MNRKEMKRIILLAALLLAGVSAWGQGGNGNIPADVFYLMPTFEQGTVYISGQQPAEGKLNICAEDHSLRFLDDDGKEMSSKSDDIVRVVIDTIVFVRDEGAFYRIYPVTDEVSVAFRRNVEILRDAKVGAYGSVDRTSSIREYSAIHSDGVMHKLETSKNYPYRVYESCALYKGGTIIPFNKRSLRKHFPDRKADLDAYFKSNRSLPEKLEETKAFLSRLISGEPLSEQD
jgi:hypothetical protein